MELYSSNPREEIISFLVVELDSAPPYEAISYVWG
jgi:hypothetical protein